jgi:Cysteine-rich CPXCG
MKHRQLDDGFGEEEDSREDLGAPDENRSALETEVEVECPYCGEVVAITLDVSGGATQSYVEDCQVCCRPWQVHVRLDTDGAVEVRVEAAS